MEDGVSQLVTGTSMTAFGRMEREMRKEGTHTQTATNTTANGEMT